MPDPTNIFGTDLDALGPEGTTLNSGQFAVQDGATSTIVNKVARKAGIETLTGGKRFSLRAPRTGRFAPPHLNKSLILSAEQNALAVSLRAAILDIRQLNSFKTALTSPGITQAERTDFQNKIQRINTFSGSGLNQLNDFLKTRGLALVLILD